MDELVAGGGVGCSGGGTTGITCAVLPCKNALPRGSPETAKTGVALQLESKTGILAVGVVGVIVVFGARFFTWRWRRCGLYWSFGLAVLRLKCEGTGRSRNSSEIRATTLLRDPATPSAVSFRNILLPTLGRTNRAITISATGRTRKRICEEIECQLWVLARR